MSEKIQKLIKTLNGKPFALGDKNFIYLNNINESYIVTKGSVYIFAWLLKDGTPTSERQYICTINAGELLIGSPDYNIADKNLTYCFYALLDYNTELSIIESSEIFNSKQPELADMINDFADKISYIIIAYNKDSQQHKALYKILDNISYKQDAWLGASDKRKLLWLKPRQSGSYHNKGEEPVEFDKAQLIPVTTNMHINFPREHAFDIVETKTLLQQGLLAESMLMFGNYIKHTSYKYLSTNIKQQKLNFSSLKNAQNNYLSSIFHRLYDSYKGRVNIAPIGAVLDDKASMILLMNEVCRSTNITPVLANYQLLETLDYCNKDDLERALNIQSFNSRDIVLKKNWYKKNRWILLSKLLDSDRTVLINNFKNKYYYYDPQLNKWNIINDEAAQNISDKAMMVYRPLPDKPITKGSDLLKHGLFFAKRDLWQILLTGILIATISLVTPIAMGHLLSEALPNYDIGKINGFLLALLASAIGTLVFQLSNSVALLRLESKFALDIHAAIWMRLLKLPLNFFGKYSVGDLSNRANLLNDIRRIWSSATTSAILSILSMTATFFLLFYYSSHLALIAILLFIIIIVSILFFIRRIMPMIADSYEYRGKLDGLVFQLLGGIHKLRIAAKENTMLALWSNVYANLTTVTRKFMLSNSVMQSITQILPLLSNIIIFAFIYYALFEGKYNKDFDLGDFISFNAAFGQLIAATISISGILISAVSTIPMFKRIMPILENEIESDESKVTVTNFQGNIEFNHISFRYREDMQYVLKDLSFNIRAGEYVAIVGKSGSGKSTIAKLLMGFETQNLGMILVDGSDTKILNKSSLRSHIGVVLQNSGIIPGSILDNVSAGNSLMTQDDVWDVLEKVGLKKEVDFMPMKLHTIVAEGGIGLSGGQLQRLVIARALANNPELLLFDEATSAMDNISQAIIKDTLGKMNITRIVIAHRLSTIENVDKIYVLDNGNIIESGHYQELVKAGGFFYELVKRQVITI